MRNQRARTVAVVLVACLTGPLAGGELAQAASGLRHQAPSKQGIIVWTHRAQPGSEHLMVARADGSHRAVLTAPQRDTVDIDAQISPSGNWVAYEEDTADTAKLRLVRSDGRADHAVDVGCVDPCAVVAAPTWLSEHRIAFTKVFGPFDDQTGNATAAVLWTARPDGTHAHRFSPPGIEGKAEDSYLRASADRSFLTFRRANPASGLAALFRINRDGSHLQQLTPFAINAEVNDLSTARRGPTKDLLVFESFGRGDPDATFVDVGTVPATCRSLAGCTRRLNWLTDNSATGRRNANPQWSPHGRSLVLTDRPSVDVEDANIFTGRRFRLIQRQISVAPEFDYRPAWGER